jgi:hypothetical protein
MADRERRRRVVEDPKLIFVKALHLAKSNPFCLLQGTALTVQLAFLLWSYLALLDIDSDVHKLWIYGIIYSVVQGALVLGMCIAAVVYAWQKGSGMAPFTNGPIYIGFAIHVVCVFLVVTQTFVWLVRYSLTGDDYSNGIVIIPAVATEPILRLYYNVHLLNVVFDTISIMVLLHAVLAHCNAYALVDSSSGTREASSQRARDGPNSPSSGKSYYEDM